MTGTRVRGPCDPAPSPIRSTPDVAIDQAAPPAARSGAIGGRKGSDAELALDLLAGDRVAEDDSAGGDVELADLWVVGARALVQDRDGAQKA